MATSTLPTAATARPLPPLLALVRDAWHDPERRSAVVGAALALGLLSYLFWPNLVHFVQVWSSDENYSHGFLVPFLSLYFANEAARRGPVAVRSGVVLGSLMIGTAMAIKVSTVVIPSPVVGDYSLILALAGVSALLGGTALLGRYWFAFFFLIFLVPLPVAFYSTVANPLQLMVSRLATSMLNLLDIPALCEGALITLAGDNQLFVAEACSGMRQLTGFLALTTAWAYLSARPGWARLLLIASSIPIAMTANVVRVTITGVITYHLDPRYASGAFHTVEGLAMMALGLLMIATIAWVLDQAARLIATPRPRRAAAASAGAPLIAADA